MLHVTAVIGLNLFCCCCCCVCDDRHIYCYMNVINCAAWFNKNNWFAEEEQG